VTTERPLVLDTGALIQLEQSPTGPVYATCVEALERGRPVLLPTVVYAQAWRASPRQAPIARLRRSCTTVPFSDAVAEAVGRILGVSNTSDVVDAAVVLTAAANDAAVLTSDPADIGKIAESIGAVIPLIVL
jgi:hypothetical protein